MSGKRRMIGCERSRGEEGHHKSFSYTIISVYKRDCGGYVASYLRKYAVYFDLQKEISNIKVALCVVIRYPFYDFLQGILMVWVLPFFDPFADQVAHDATEKIMARVGQEGSGIGQHTDKIP